MNQGRLREHLGSKDNVAITRSKKIRSKMIDIAPAAPSLSPRSKRPSNFLAPDVQPRGDVGKSVQGKNSLVPRSMTKGQVRAGKNSTSAEAKAAPRTEKPAQEKGVEGDEHGRELENPWDAIGSQNVAVTAAQPDAVVLGVQTSHDLANIDLTEEPPVLADSTFKDDEALGSPDTFGPMAETNQESPLTEKFFESADVRADGCTNVVDLSFPHSCSEESKNSQANGYDGTLYEAIGSSVNENQADNDDRDPCTKQDVMDAETHLGLGVVIGDSGAIASSAMSIDSVSISVPDSSKRKGSHDSSFAEWWQWTEWQQWSKKSNLAPLLPAARSIRRIHFQLKQLVSSFPFVVSVTSCVTLLPSCACHAHSMSLLSLSTASSQAEGDALVLSALSQWKSEFESNVISRIPLPVMIAQLPAKTGQQGIAITNTDDVGNEVVTGDKNKMSEDCSESVSAPAGSGADTGIQGQPRTDVDDKHTERGDRSTPKE